MRSAQAAAGPAKASRVSSTTWLTVILFAGLAARAILAPSNGFVTDTNTFIAWATQLATHPPWQFYQAASFADYPPGYLYVLWAVGHAYVLLAPHGNGEPAKMLVKAPAVLMDLVDGVLLYSLVRRIADERWAIIAAAAFVLNPAIVFISAVWGQVDSVSFGLALLAASALLASSRATDRGYIWSAAGAWAALACSLLVKPQAAILVPLFAAFTLCSNRALRTRIAALSAGAVAALAAAFILTLPFHPAWNPLGVLFWLYHQYDAGKNVYAYNSVNAFNLWTIVRPFWQSDAQHIGPLPQYAWGVLLVVIATILLVARFVQQKTERSFVECAALLGLAFFLLSTRMHERYVYDGLAFTVCAIPLAGRYVWSCAILSFTLFTNLVYSLQYLNVVTHAIPGVNQADMWGGADHVLSLLNVATFFWLAYTYLGEQPAEPVNRPSIASIAKTFVIKVRRYADSLEGTTPFSRLDYVLCGALTAVSFAILYVRFWFPPGKIFDEVYFARAAEEYLHRQYIYENTHPPVTKLLITLSTLVFGDNSYGWRFLDVVFGALAIWLLYALLRRVTGSTAFSAYGAGLFVFDGMHFVQSRIATPESFVVCFSLATTYAFYRLWIVSPPRTERIPWRDVWRKRAVVTAAAAAIAVGVIAFRFPLESLPAKIVAFAICFAAVYLAHRVLVDRVSVNGFWLTLFAVSIALLVASKWYGVMMFGVACTIVLLCRKRFVLDVVLATVVVVAGCIYFASYTPQFIGLSDTPGAPPRAYTLTDVVNMQYDAFEYHDHLRATHPYQSRWWQWPLDLRPILYYAKYGGQGKTATAAMIYTLPNPLILWLGLLTVPLVGYLGIMERKKGYVLIVLTYVAQWLPWMGSPRISFAYHFYVDIPLICACTAIAMQRLWLASRDRESATAAKVLIATYFAAVALAFVYFYPVLSGMTIPSSQWMQRMWLHSWI